MNLTFFSEEFELSAKAFAILEHSDPSLIVAILADNKFHSAAAQVLGQSNPKSILLSRLSSLTLVAFMSDSDASKESCGFIFQMLYYLSEPSVLSMFEAICSAEQGDPRVQEWLLGLNFQVILFKEIDRIIRPQKLERWSAEAAQVCGLLHVFRYCANSPCMRSAFCTPAFAEVLCRFVDELDDFVEDCRWQALSAIYCKEVGEILGSMFHSAVYLLQTPRAVTVSGVSAIELLTQIMKVDDVFRPFMCEADVVKTIMGLIVANPDHSILHGASREFLAAALLHRKTRGRAALDITPTAIKTIQEVTNRNVLATMFDIMNTIVGIGKTDAETFGKLKEIDGFLKFVKEDFAQHTMMINKSYGGPLPGPTCMDVKALVNQTLSRRGY